MKEKDDGVNLYFLISSIASTMMMPLIVLLMLAISLPGTLLFAVSYMMFLIHMDVAVNGC